MATVFYSSSKPYLGIEPRPSSMAILYMDHITNQATLTLSNKVNPESRTIFTLASLGTVRLTGMTYNYIL
ncbi:hypothetical protein AVEN_220194-1 [Araneus ventricosus]|uniref:Uncharacterized protein n=1 Tax=Araneus ventricosus TaxID=182803 RepID=A0A4Y2H1S4_ARAVE|nr:hypothetical protein AVEN_220194-1 [Araneus ventricosus]